MIGHQDDRHVIFGTPRRIVFRVRREAKPRHRRTVPSASNGSRVGKPTGSTVTAARVDASLRDEDRPLREGAVRRWCAEHLALQIRRPLHPQRLAAHDGEGRFV